mgnify:CR=1 FL=1
MKTLLVGCGPMASDYYKVIKSLDIEVDIIGRGKKSAETFEKENDAIVISRNIDDYIKSERIHNVKNAIISVNIENLYEVCNKLLYTNIENILLEKPGYLYDNEIYNLEKKSRVLNKKIFIAYNRRFYNSVIQLNKIVENDGGVKSCNFDFTEWSHVIDDLKINYKVKQKWFMANSSHVLDLAFFIIGRPKKLESFISGKIKWHKSGSRFVGSGVSEKDILFSYHANWLGPGRWSLEFITNNNKLILCPMENLKLIKLGSVKENEIIANDNDDTNFKPGLFKQVDGFLNNKFKNLCSIKDQISNIKYYNKISNYNS